MPQLRVLTLDQCKIRKIESLTACKKLTNLSLRGNLIEDCSVQGGAQQLIELKSLCLSRNKITQIRTIYGYPNLEELELDNNPLTRVHPQATMNIKNLQSLDLSHCKFQNVHQDELKFLKRLQKLKSLYMNFCYEETDYQTLDTLPPIYDLETLQI